MSPPVMSGPLSTGNSLRAAPSSGSGTPPMVSSLLLLPRHLTSDHLVYLWILRGLSWHSLPFIHPCCRCRNCPLPTVDEENERISMNGACSSSTSIWICRSGFSTPPATSRSTPCCVALCSVRIPCLLSLLYSCIGRKATPGTGPSPRSSQARPLQKRVQARKRLVG